MPNQPALPEAVPDLGAVADNLRLSVTRLARILRRQDLDALPPTLSSALHSISFDGPLTLGDLAALEHVAPPTITRTTKPAAAPTNDDFQPRTTPTPTTMATISIASTAEAKNVVKKVPADTAGNSRSAA